MPAEVSQECLRRGIANIFRKKTVLFPLLDSTRERKATKLWCWRRLPMRIYTSGAGSLNDINILNKSSIVGSILNGTFDLKIAPYTINNTHRDWLYFLVDGIYPKYSIFINTFQHPQDEKETYFATCQEACRKDIERAFGCLVQQFQILQRPIKSWYWANIIDIMDICIILHKMIVESRLENFSVSEYLESGSEQWYAATDVFRRTSETENNPPSVVSLFKHADEQTDNVLYEANLATRMAIRVGAVNENILRNTAEHFSLKSDLMEHMWRRRSTRRHRRNTNKHDDDE
jgi:hypothetical protein